MKKDWRLSMSEVVRTEEVYNAVSIYYKNKDLAPDKFSNRLFVIKSIVFRNYSMRDCIDFLDRREHWWECDREYRAEIKSQTRNQIKSILKKIDLQLNRDGLKDLKDYLKDY